MGLVGTLFETYILGGPLVTFAASSSMTPSYRYSTRYFCAALWESNFVTIWTAPWPLR